MGAAIIKDGASKLSRQAVLAFYWADTEDVLDVDLRYAIIKHLHGVIGQGELELYSHEDNTAARQNIAECSRYKLINVVLCLCRRVIVNHAGNS
jgi:hypothetical protein